MLDGLLDTINVLEKEKGFFKAIKKIAKWLGTAYTIVNFLSRCCMLTEMLAQLAWGKLKDALVMFFNTYLWGPAKKWWGKVLNALIGNGPGLLGCIADKALEGMDKEIKNLEDFENGEITQKLEVPNFVTVLAKYYPECRAKNFWEQIKGSWKEWICAAIMFVAIIATGGSAAGICVFMEESGIDYILQALNLLLAVISVLLLLNTYNENVKAIALARERMNIQLEAQNILTGYAEALQNTMEAISASLATNSILQDLTYPRYDTVKLIFMSDRAGVLNNGDDMCSGDMITIVYDFEKLNQTEGFESQLFISNSHTKTLHFDDLKGEYGPVQTDILLGTTPGVDPSEPYTFTLVYQSKRLDYELNYVNHECK